MTLLDLASRLAGFLSVFNLLVAFVLYYTVSSILVWYRLRHFPGPFLGSFSYWWIIANSYAGHPQDAYTRLNKKHGPLVRIGPNDLITDDPNIIRRMNSARSSYGRSSWYRAMRLNPHEECMLSQRDPAEHDRLKSKISNAYAGKENPSLESDIDEQLHAFVDLIRKKYLTVGSAVKPLDLGTAVQYLTLDTITKIAFGEPFGFMETDSDVYQYIKTAEESVPVLQFCAEVPPACSIVFSRFILGTIGPKHTDEKGLGKLMGVAKKVVAERYGPSAKDQRDMLGAFVRHGLTQTECETEALFQIIAGSDTTATAIRATFLHIITSPAVYQTLRSEIMSAARDGRISNPIASEEAKKLPYLQAVIFEGLRMHAPFTGLCSKEVPPEGDTLHGQFLPGGTRVSHNTWGILRRTDVFGEDVDVFRPSRWLECDLATRDVMQRTTEMVFGYGRWGCAGKTVAFIELNKVFVEVFRNFDIQIIYPAKPWVSLCRSLFMQSQMYVRVTEVSVGDGEATV